MSSVNAPRKSDQHLCCSLPRLLTVKIQFMDRQVLAKCADQALRTYEEQSIKVYTFSNLVCIFLKHCFMVKPLFEF